MAKKSRKNQPKSYRVHDYRFPEKVERSFERAEPQPYKTRYKPISRKKEIRWKKQLLMQELRENQVRHRKPKMINLKQYSFESLLKKVICSKKQKKQRREYFGYKKTGRKKGSGSSIFRNRFGSC